MVIRVKYGTVPGSLVADKWHKPQCFINMSVSDYWKRWSDLIIFQPYLSCSRIHCIALHVAYGVLCSAGSHYLIKIKNAFWIKSVALDRFSLLHLMFRVWHVMCDVWCTLSGLIFEQKRLQISNFWKKSDIRAFDFPRNSGRNSEIIRENLVSE